MPRRCGRSLPRTRGHFRSCTCGTTRRCPSGSRSAPPRGVGHHQGGAQAASALCGPATRAAAFGWRLGLGAGGAEVGMTPSGTVDAGRGRTRALCASCKTNGTNQVRPRLDRGHAQQGLPRPRARTGALRGVGGRGAGLIGSPCLRLSPATIVPVPRVRGGGGGRDGAGVTARKGRRCIQTKCLR